MFDGIISIKQARYLFSIHMWNIIIFNLVELRSLLIKGLFINFITVLFILESMAFELIHNLVITSTKLQDVY